jgi:hypothetical protein
MSALEDRVSFASWLQYRWVTDDDDDEIETERLMNSLIDAFKPDMTSRVIIPQGVQQYTLRPKSLRSLVSAHKDLSNAVRDENGGMKLDAQHMLTELLDGIRAPNGVNVNLFQVKSFADKHRVPRR